MRLEITGRHVDITPALRQVIERALSRIERILNDHIVSIRVILTLEKYRHRTEILLHARGDKSLRGLGEGTKWPISVRQAVDKLEQQAATIKGKWTEGKHSATRRRKQAIQGADEAAVDVAPPAPRVIRATRYAVKPMSIADASARLEATTESFIVFRNADTEAVGILYRRKDGNLGLIEPD
jgi:putative sigma-54 modulation protein